MEYRYRSIHKFGKSEFEEKKSKFIGWALPVKTEKEAEDFIEDIRSEHREATHNCTAYIINDNLKRFDDDGEPSHTAGMPMLTTLEAEEIKEAVVVVTRYFGGTLLGKGGLVRAYTKGCKTALESAIVVDKVLHNEVKLDFAYEYIGALDNFLITNNIEIIDKNYGESVGYVIYSECEKEDRLKQDLLDLTSANIKWTDLSQGYLSMKDGRLLLD